MTAVPYRIGEDVAALYLGPHGTCLSPGYVSSIEAHNTGWTVKVVVAGKAEPVEYRTSWTGHSDFLGRAADHPQMFPALLQRPCPGCGAAVGEDCRWHCPSNCS